MDYSCKVNLLKLKCLIKYLHKGLLNDMFV